jgi:hypothetical protein
MTYEVRDDKGNVLAETDDWLEFMAEFKRLRKETTEPLTLHKNEEKA